MAYSPDSQWRNRSDFLKGRAEIVDFLTKKWQKEKEYRLIKVLAAEVLCSVSPQKGGREEGS